MSVNPLKISISGANTERGWARDAHLPALAAMAPANAAELWRRFELDIRSRSRTATDFTVAVKLHRVLEAIEVSSDEGRNVTPHDSDMKSWEE